MPCTVVHVLLPNIKCRFLVDITKIDTMGLFQDKDGWTSSRFLSSGIIVACLLQTFFLKVTKRRNDGTTTLTKTVPCGGSTTHTCLVEVSVLLDGGNLTEASLVWPPFAYMAPTSTFQGPCIFVLTLFQILK